MSTTVEMFESSPKAATDRLRGWANFETIDFERTREFHKYTFREKIQTEGEVGDRHVTVPVQKFVRYQSDFSTGSDSKTPGAAGVYTYTRRTTPVTIKFLEKNFFRNFSIVIKLLGSLNIELA